MNDIINTYEEMQKGGPRYDENMTAQERTSAKNGIWLCQSCSKLIDSDVNRYTVAKLKEWKKLQKKWQFAIWKKQLIIALNTGVLRTRDGSILKISEGKSAVANAEWREKLSTICDMLVVLRKRLKTAKDTGAYFSYGEGEIEKSNTGGKLNGNAWKEYQSVFDGRRGRRKN